MIISFLPPPCPKCTNELTWGDIDSRFNCPNCHVELRSNHLGLLLVMLTLGPLPFLPFLLSDALWANAVGAILTLVVPMWIFGKLLYVRIVRPNAT